MRGNLPRASEKDHVSIGVADLESAQAVVSILQGHAECRAQSGKLSGKGIGIGSVDEGVPSQVLVSG